MGTPTGTPVRVVAGHNPGAKARLRQLVESGTLRNHAEAVLADAYAEARRQAADETELSLDVFPVEDARGLDELLAEPGA